MTKISVIILVILSLFPVVVDAVAHRGNLRKRVIRKQAGIKAQNAETRERIGKNHVDSQEVVDERKAKDAAARTEPLYSTVFINFPPEAAM